MYYRSKYNLPLFLLSIFLWSLGCSTSVQAPGTDDLLTGKLMLTDTIVTVGQTTDIFAQLSAGSEVGQWHLIWADAFGDVVYTGNPENTHVEFLIPDGAFRRSGYVHLSLCRNGQTVDQQVLRIRSGKPVKVIETYAGNKTMVANSDQTAMVVAIPKDSLGNPVEMGTPLNFHYRYPDETKVIVEKKVDHLLSAIELNAGSRTGKILVGVSSGEARSVEETVELTPGWPRPFRIDVVDWFPYADDRQNSILHTNFIQDALGNPVSDGTLILFIVMEHDRLVAKYQGFTSGGSAKIHIKNPDYATQWEIVALAEGKIQSNSLKLDFAPYITSLPFSYQPEERTIIAGPITGNLGQMVTDDLRVKLSLEQSDTIFYFNGLTETGFCRIYLPVGFPAGRYRGRMEAGGMEHLQEITVSY